MRTKVFVIGLQRTGTTSLGAALEQLGYCVCGAVGNWWPEIGEQIDNLAHRVAPHYDAFQDNPWPMVYRAMANEYPDSKYILTTRETASWIDSMRYYFEDGFSPFERWYYGTWSIAELTDKQLEKRLLHHQDLVIRFFMPQPERLLFFHLGRDGWRKLSNFLNCEMPNELFPHLNRNGKEKGTAVPLLYPQPDEARLRNDLGLSPIEPYAARDELI